MHSKSLTVLAGLSAIALSACGPASFTGEEQRFNSIKQAVGWSSTASLYNGGRKDHTVTALGSGEALIAGGSSGLSSLTSAERYSSGSWSATGSMAHARTYHTATQLSSGKVLVTGGLGSSSWTNSAEIYDPSSGTWSSAASMTDARGGHTATLLSDGRVMVVGGYNGTELTSIEVYDPDTDSWEYKELGLNDARSAHTATVLSDDSVLVAGGTTYGNVSNTAEICVPSNPAAIPPVLLSCSYTGSMSFERATHAAAVLLPSDDVLVVGGFDSLYASQDTAEVYSGGSWTTVGSMSDKRSYLTANRLSSGDVLVVGGMDDGNGATQYHASAELYDPSLGSWSSTSTMATARTWHAATLLTTGNVLVTGGYDGSSDVGTSTEYTP